MLLDPDSGVGFDLLGFVVTAEKALGKPVDVIVLNRASEHLKYLVRRDAENYERMARWRNLIVHYL